MSERVTQGSDKFKRIPFSEETQEWLPELDTELPIRGEEIPDFRAWVNWNGFDPINPIRTHSGFDFAAYLNADGNIVLGLSPQTKIRAVADGVIYQVRNDLEHAGFINIQHGARNSGMFSHYSHVIPFVEGGQPVKKGEVIAVLHQDSGDEIGRLTHLHLNLHNGWETRRTSLANGEYDRFRREDPRILGDELYRYSAVPQESSHFAVENLPEARIVIANFLQLRLPEPKSR